MVTTLCSGTPCSMMLFSVSVAVGQACTQAPQDTQSESMNGSSCPALTRIDAQQTGRVITMDQPLTRATWVVGFRITGGLLDVSVGSHKHGAGIYMDSHLGAVSPTIRGNWIEHNVIDGTSWNYGAGKTRLTNWMKKTS